MPSLSLSPHTQSLCSRVPTLAKFKLFEKRRVDSLVVCHFSFSFFTFHQTEVSPFRDSRVARRHGTHQHLIRVTGGQFAGAAMRNLVARAILRPLRTNVGTWQQQSTVGGEGRLGGERKGLLKYQPLHTVLKGKFNK